MDITFLDSLTTSFDTYYNNKDALYLYRLLLSHEHPTSFIKNYQDDSEDKKILWKKLFLRNVANIKFISRNEIKELKPDIRKFIKHAISKRELKFSLLSDKTDRDEVLNKYSYLFDNLKNEDTSYKIPTENDIFMLQKCKSIFSNSNVYQKFIEDVKFQLPYRYFIGDIAGYKVKTEIDNILVRKDIIDVLLYKFVVRYYTKSQIAEQVINNYLDLLVFTQSVLLSNKLKDTPYNNYKIRPFVIHFDCHNVYIIRLSDSHMLKLKSKLKETIINYSDDFFDNDNFFYIDI